MAEGLLTTHVLDTATGVPAAGVDIELYRLSGQVRERLTEIRTNDDGRTDAPLIAKGELEEGAYELIFHAGAYFDERGLPTGPAFLDVVPVRFTIADASAHYHVPLLVSPYGYSTYRGS